VAVKGRGSHERSHLSDGHELGVNSIRLRERLPLVKTIGYLKDHDWRAGPILVDKLTGMHTSYILVHMRTTLNIDDELLARASKLTAIKEKTALVRAGLEALVARESAKRLAALGGTERALRAIPRRRSGEAR
jgi:Arc/MetJ family transcription regulator